MNFKKFAIFSCVIVAIIAATMVVLGCIRVNSKLDIEEPTTFVYYLKTSVGLEKTKTDSPKIYNNLKKKVDEMTNLSIFDYMAKGISLKAKPGQDYDNNFPPYRNLNKEEGFFLEMQYERRLPINLRSLNDRFQKIPYGWNELDIAFQYISYQFF